MKIHKNDLIIVLTGKDKGKKGKVLKTYPDSNKVIVEKINIVKKHNKPSKTLPQGGIIETERPMLISKIMLVCPHCGKPARIGHTLSKENKNVRICRKCHEVVD